jgi:hypothetical protein
MYVLIHIWNLDTPPPKKSPWNYPTNYLGHFMLCRNFRGYEAVLKPSFNRGQYNEYFPLIKFFQYAIKKTNPHRNSDTWGELRFDYLEESHSISSYLISKGMPRFLITADVQCAPNVQLRSYGLVV